MKDYFVLTYSENCDFDTVREAGEILKKYFPNKHILVFPSVINFQDYDKEELLNLLNFYTNYMKGLINE